MCVGFCVCDCAHNCESQRAVSVGGFGFLPCFCGRLAPDVSATVLYLPTSSGVFLPSATYQRRGGVRDSCQHIWLFDLGSQIKSCKCSYRLTLNIVQGNPMQLSPATDLGTVHDFDCACTVLCKL